MIKALIFDFDGTMLDTETAWLKAYQNAYRRQNQELPQDLYAPSIGSGQHVFQPVEHLMGYMQLPINLDALRSSIHHDFEQYMAHEQLRPGVAEYLREAKAFGLKLGLVSTSFRKRVDAYLDQLGLTHCFDYICTPEDVQRPSPEPDMYLHTLNRLGVKPREAIAFEDSPNGVKAARRAGVYCVLTPNQVTAQLEFQPVHYRLESLAELELLDLVANPDGTSARQPSAGDMVPLHKSAARLQGKQHTLRLAVKKGSRPGEARRGGVPFGPAASGFWGGGRR